MSAEITEILNFIFANWQGIIALLGFGGAAYEGKSVMDFFDSENLLKNVAPWILKLFPGVHTWTMTTDTLALIKSAVPIAELQTVLNAVEAAEKNRLGMYDINSSIGTIHIEYGVVTNSEILTAAITAQAVQEAAAELALPDTTTLNADGKTVGDAKVVSITSEKRVLTDGVSLAKADFIGKEVDVELEGVSRGWVVAGLLWDGDLIAKGEFFVAKAGTREDLTEKAFRFPQHDKNDNGPEFSPGTHTLEVAIGYFAGHDDIQGDVTLWKKSTSLKVQVV